MFVTLTADQWLALAHLFLLWAFARATKQETSALLAGVIAVSVTNGAPSSLLVVIIIGIGTYLIKLTR